MIVVTTPAGQIGRQVLDRILDSGVPVRVIARDPFPVADYRAMMLRHGASEAVAQDMADAIEATNGIYDTELRDRHAAAPTSFRQWCQAILRPAIQA